MKPANPFLRFALAGAASALFLGWGARQFQSASALREWRAFERSGRSLEASKNPPENASALLSAARSRQRSLFPPDTAGSEKLLRRALPLAPMSAVLWMEMAQALLFQGKAREAALALARSDALDPNFPAQRLEAIRLWHLLGDEEKGLGLARRIAGFGHALREGAIEELASLGYPPARIFRELAFADLPPADAARLLDRLRSDSPEQARALFEEFPESFFQDRAFLAKAVGIASRPLLPEVAAKIWRARAGDKLAELPGLDGEPSGLPADNLDLREPAFSRPFHFGWQLFPGGARESASWLAPRSDGPAHGTIRLNFRDAARSRTKAFRWTFHRLLVPPGGPIRVALRARLEPPGQSSCRLEALVLEQARLKSEWSDPRGRGWTRLEVEIPARTEWRVVELALERELGPETSRPSSFVDLGGLEIAFEGASEAPR